MSSIKDLHIVDKLPTEQELGTLQNSLNETISRLNLEVSTHNVSISPRNMNQVFFKIALRH